MKTFREFLQIKEGGLWSNPGTPDGKGTKRPPQKDLYNSRYGDANAAGAVPMGGSPASPMPPQQMPPMQPQKKTMKKK